MLEPHNVHFFEAAAGLRAWFEANHDKATELWIGFHRRGSGKPSLRWPEVVDQALCFGWIDGIRKGLDVTSYANRLTPRNKKSTWSALNIRKFEELTRRSLVHPSGQAAFDARDERRTAIYSYENQARGLDAEREGLFQADKVAWEFFESQPPGYRRTAAYWVVSAKREETRDRRLGILIASSRKRRRVPPLAP